LILVDTSVWVDHLRRRNANLAGLLDRGEVLMHPFVIGEIACGSLTHRRFTLDLLQHLPAVAVAESDEALGFIDSAACTARVSATSTSTCWRAPR
jgi:predicted nucleic acid-binding protein